MPQPLGIKEIKSKLLSPALTSLYYVQIPLPSTGPLNLEYFNKKGIPIEQDRLNLMCCETVLPGSRLATLELNNDRTGVTEKHAHRKIFDDRIDLTFYVNAENYMPIRFFETWINYITRQSTEKIEDTVPTALDKDYFYRFEYPDTYMSDSGMRITKFEKSTFGTTKNTFRGFLATDPTNAGQLTYTFMRVFPLSIASMPVSYDQSNLLKCTVSMSYIRYVVDNTNPPITKTKSETNTRTTGPADSPFLRSSDIPFNSGFADIATDLDFTSAFTADGQANFNNFNSNINFGITSNDLANRQFPANALEGFNNPFQN